MQVRQGHARTFCGRRDNLEMLDDNELIEHNFDKNFIIVLSCGWCKGEHVPAEDPHNLTLFCNKEKGEFYNTLRLKAKMMMVYCNVSNSCPLY